MIKLTDKQIAVLNHLGQQGLSKPTNMSYMLSTHIPEVDPESIKYMIELDKEAKRVQEKQLEVLYNINKELTGEDKVLHKFSAERFVFKRKDHKAINKVASMRIKL